MLKSVDPKMLKSADLKMLKTADLKTLKSSDIKQISLPCLLPRYCLQNVKSSCFTGLFPAMGTQR